jgi:hypothetical protein
LHLELTLARAREYDKNGSQCANLSEEDEPLCNASDWLMDGYEFDNSPFFRPPVNEAGANRPIRSIAMAPWKIDPSLVNYLPLFVPLSFSLSRPDGRNPCNREGWE